MALEGPQCAGVGIALNARRIESDYRTYVHGDDFRHLDWNVYGRLERLFLKLYEEERELPVRIFLDASESMTFGEPRKFDFARQVAAAIAADQGRVAFQTGHAALEVIVETRRFAQMLAKKECVIARGFAVVATVAIVVGFEQETEFVFSTQKQPLRDLNQLVQKGGSPIGLLRFDKESDQIQGSYRPFEEYASEEWAKKYLEGLLDNTKDIVSMSRQRSMPDAY